MMILGPLSPGGGNDEFTAWFMIGVAIIAIAYAWVPRFVKGTTKQAPLAQSLVVSAAALYFILTSLNVLLRHHGH